MVALHCLSVISAKAYLTLNLPNINDGYQGRIRDFLSTEVMLHPAPIPEDYSLNLCISLHPFNKSRRKVTNMANFDLNVFLCILTDMGNSF